MGRHHARVARVELIRQAVVRKRLMQGIDAIRHIQRRAFLAFGQEVAHRAIHRARQANRDPFGGHKGERSIDGADGDRVAGEHAAPCGFHVHVGDSIQRRVEQIDHTADRMTHGGIVGYFSGGIKRGKSRALEWGAEREDFSTKVMECCAGRRCGCPPRRRRE